MTPNRRATAIIADDEPRLAAYLRERLAELWPDLVVAGVAANGPEAQALIAAEGPDIAFLDIRMPGLSGLDVAKSAGRDVHVVFVTAFDEYAVDAFERAAVNYLLKPVSYARLAQTIERLRQRLRRLRRAHAFGRIQRDQPVVAEPAVEPAPGRQHERDAARCEALAMQCRGPAPHMVGLNLAQR